MERQDWILVVLAAADDYALTPVQLQKALFLAGQDKPELVGTDFYSFTPYAYGPFDRMVYQDADHLAAEGLVMIEPPFSGYRTYKITASGIRHGSQLSDFDAKVGGVCETVKWVKARSFSQLVSDIYERFPEMRVNSIFR